MPRTKLAEAQKRPKPPATPLERQNAIMKNVITRNGMDNHRQFARYAKISEQVISNCFHGRANWFSILPKLYQSGFLEDNELIAMFKIPEVKRGAKK
jgi:hypothetical protein